MGSIWLRYILKEENLSMTDDVYPVIYENSSGSMRDSISILERLIVTANGEEIDLKIAEDTLGITPSSRIKIFLNKLLNENEYDIINELENLANESFDIELFFRVNQSELSSVGRALDCSGCVAAI